MRLTCDLFAGSRHKSGTDLKLELLSHCLDGCEILMLSLPGSDSPSFWHVHCGYGVLWLREQQGYQAPAACGCKYCDLSST